MTDILHSPSVPGGDEAGGAHTPGPWFSEYRRNARGGYSSEVFDADGEVVATAAWFPVRLSETTTTTNREANARLIAAAPELLAVAIKSHEPYVGLDEEDIRCLYGADEADLAMALRDAIAKATQPAKSQQEGEGA